MLFCFRSYIYLLNKILPLVTFSISTNSFKKKNVFTSGVYILAQNFENAMPDYFTATDLPHYFNNITDMIALYDCSL